MSMHQKWQTFDPSKQRDRAVSRGHIQPSKNKLDRQRVPAATYSTYDMVYYCPPARVALELIFCTARLYKRRVVSASGGWKLHVAWGTATTVRTTPYFYQYQSTLTPRVTRNIASHLTDIAAPHRLVVPLRPSYRPPVLPSRRHERVCMGGG